MLNEDPGYTNARMAFPVLCRSPGPNEPILEEQCGRLHMNNGSDSSTKRGMLMERGIKVGLTHWSNSAVKDRDRVRTLWILAVRWITRKGPPSQHSMFAARFWGSRLECVSR